ncbi:MAG: molybdenum cofactor biosynthesis protein, partial [Anaerolineales bacterium]
MAISVGILTVSDRCYRGEAEDVSSPLIGQWVTDELGGQVKRQAVVPDERDLIQETLISWSDEQRLDLILTTGGTGF